MQIVNELMSNHLTVSYGSKQMLSSLVLGINYRSKMKFNYTNLHRHIFFVLLILDSVKYTFINHSRFSLSRNLAHDV